MVSESESEPEIDEEFLLPGTVVGGRYQIGEVLAWGGMGIVYRALHLELGSEVAVKTMRRRLVNDDDAYERFVREARNTAQLQTSHVAKVFDFGRAGDGRPYLVMELLHGEALSARIKRAPLTNEETANILIQACSGLADAHERGIVHRDLKPDNLFLSDREDRGSELKLLDFGVAKSRTSLTESLRPLTLAGGAVGSPSYMAPEQMHSREDLDQRADIWALGAVAYEGLAGQPAFDGKTLTEICAKVLTETPRPLCELRDDVWPELDAAISRCLQREPERRFQDVLELSQALELALEAHDWPKPSGRASELVTKPSAVSVQAPVPVSLVDCTAGTEANLDVSVELSQNLGPPKGPLAATARVAHGSRRGRCRCVGVPCPAQPGYFQQALGDWGAVARCRFRAPYRSTGFARAGGSSGPGAAADCC